LRKSASSKSMAVTKTMIGILYRFAGRSRALACFGSTSRQASNTTTTPSMPSKKEFTASSVYSSGPSRNSRSKEMLVTSRVRGHLRDGPEEPTPYLSRASRTALWTGFSLLWEKSYHFLVRDLRCWCGKHTMMPNVRDKASVSFAANLSRSSDNIGAVEGIVSRAQA
jgi:hypothetical protein